MELWNLGKMEAMVITHSLIKSNNSYLLNYLVILTKEILIVNFELFSLLFW